MPLEVRQYQPEDAAAWDEFVLGHEHGSPFHLLAWKKSIEATFGYRPHYLVATDGDRIAGALPLFYIKNFIIGKALISSPFAVYGGILAETDQARHALADAVKALGETLKVDYVDLRNAHEGQCTGQERVSRYVTFTQQVGPDEEQILNAIPRKTRYWVRKGLKNGFTTRRQSSEFGVFVDLYTKNLRRLGTPSFPARHFAELQANFKELLDVREVIFESKVVGAVMSFYFRDQVLPYYGASDPEYNSLGPNDYMYFDLMRWSGQNGYRVFDFGRSKKQSGSKDFKAHWGMEMRELPYEMILIRRKALPNYSPNNPMFRPAIRLWQKLPLPITRAVGPMLIRLVP